MSPVAVVLGCAELFVDLQAYRGLCRDTAEYTYNEQQNKI